MAQTWQAIEIIIVDDGSEDETYQIAKRFEDSRVKIITQENRGQSAAENTALSAAQGDYIQYLDADDLIAPNKVELQMSLLSSAGSEYVASCAWGRFSNNETDAVFTPQAVWRDFDPIEWLITSWMGGGMMHGSAWLLPRKIADAAGMWNEELSLINDFDYFTRVLLASRGVRFCEGAKTYYRAYQPNDKSNLSSAASPKALHSAYQALVLGTEALLRAENSERTRQACAASFQRFAYSYYPDQTGFVAKAEEQVRRLGGCSLPIDGGRKFKLLAAILGWKAARRLQKLRQSISLPPL